MIVRRPVFWIVAAMFVLASAGAASAFEGRVLDSVTGQPIGGATVTAGDIVARSDADGNFAIQAPAQDISARAAGYKAAPSGTEELAGGSPTIRLTPFMPKALYLSFYGIGHKPTRDAALKLIAEGHGLNALVIDVKGDRGDVAWSP